MAPEENAHGMIFGFGFDQEIDECLKEASEIQRSILSSSGSNDPSGASDQLQRVMARLEDVFRNILASLPSISFDTDSSSDSSFSSNRSSFSNSITDAYMIPSIDQSNDTVAPLERMHHTQMGSWSIISTTCPPVAIYYLQRIAEQMIDSGYAQEFVQAYSSIRKAAVDTSFLKLGIEKMSIRDIQMLGLDGLGKKIRRWIPAARVCVQELFVSEKKLVEQIFDDSSLGTVVKYTCFLETVNGPALQLLSFAQAVSSSSHRSHEKLFFVLDLYNALSDLLPDIGIIFKPGCLDSIRLEAEETLSKLAEVARVMLSEFEKALRYEISNVPTPGGAIHPMARYVMNYMKLMSVFEQTLTELIVSKPASLELTISDGLITDFVELEGKANLVLHFYWIISVLQIKLEEKSEHYKDASLAHLFMMNNICYMVQQIARKPEFTEMIGDDYLRKLKAKLTLAVIDYRRSTFAIVFRCLRSEGLETSRDLSISKSTVRKRLKNFNELFGEVCKTQAKWSVPDSQLRVELCLSISQMLISAYRSFLGRYSNYVRVGDSKYIKYSAEDLEKAVLDLFEEQTKS